jgi:Nucleotidyl transferase AbiEii toxin, Type IV TA system
LKKTSRPTTASRRRSPARQTSARTPPTRKLAPAIIAFHEVAREQRLAWYLFGAQAVAWYGVPRTTTDIDITIDLGARPLDEIVKPLGKAGFHPLIRDPSFPLETRIYPVQHEPSGWKVDLVLAGPGLEQLFLTRVQRHRIGKHEIPVISPEDLIALKVLASRPKDLEDVRGLIKVANPDHALVEETLGALQQALDQSDLLPLYAQLRAEAALPKPGRTARGEVSVSGGGGGRAGRSARGAGGRSRGTGGRRARGRRGRRGASGPGAGAR